MNHIARVRMGGSGGTGIGADSERRLIEAFHNHPVRLPGWLYKVEHGDSLDDANGIDAWAYTAYGRIGIQVKSSCYDLDEFRRKHPDADDIAIVVIRQSYSPADIAIKTIQHLEPICRRRAKRAQERRSGARR